VAHAALSALLGFHLSVWLNCSAAGAMVVAGAAIFAVLWAWNWVWRKLRMTVAVV
jgi:hypothetical protein